MLLSLIVKFFDFGIYALSEGFKSTAARGQGLLKGRCKFIISIDFVILVMHTLFCDFQRVTDLIGDILKTQLVMFFEGHDNPLEDNLLYQEIFIKRPSHQSGSAGLTTDGRRIVLIVIIEADHTFYAVFINCLTYGTGL